MQYLHSLLWSSGSTARNDVGFARVREQLQCLPITFFGRDKSAHAHKRIKIELKPV